MAKPKNTSSLSGRHPTACRAVAGRNVGAPRFLPATPNNGFDPTSRPPWLMVPLGGIRQVVFESRGMNVGDFGPVVSPPNAVVVVPNTSSNPSRITLNVRGLKKGRGHILARHSQATQCVARLDFSVNSLKTVKVYFHFLKESLSSTERQLSEVEEIVNEANNILTPQTNVKLKAIGKSHFSLDKDKAVGHVVGVPKGGKEQVIPDWDEGKLLFVHGNRSADINVFFVKDVESGKNAGKKSKDRLQAQTREDLSTTPKSLGGGKPERSNIIIEDQVGPRNTRDAKVAGRTLAHEIGHHFLFIKSNDSDVHEYQGKERPKKHLMWGGTGGGCFIPKGDAMRMNSGN